MNTVDDFLNHACPDWRMGGGPHQAMHPHTAERILRRHPDIAGANLYTRIVCGDLAGVEAVLAERSDAASEKGGPKGWPPLLYLCVGRLSLQAFRDQAIAIANALLDRGADPNAYYEGGNESIHYTALTCVAGEGEENAPPHPRRDALFRLLLERGAEPYDQQLVYNTHFHGDIQWWLELVYERSMILGRKTDWQDPDWPMFDAGGYGGGARFLLSTAIDKNNVTLAEWLLAHGANPNAAAPRSRRHSKQSLYDDAIALGATAIADLLLRYGATPSAPSAQDDEQAFVAACMRLDRESARSQLARHPEYLKSPTALFAAAKHDRADVIALLVELGAALDVREPRNQETALHIAAYAGAARAAAFLVEKGAPIDPVDQMHDGTPLWWAMWGRQASTIAVLAPHSRDLWALAATNHVGRIRELLRTTPALATMTGDSTPLFWLPDDEASAIEIIDLLVANGADPAFTRPDGKTAADVARARGMLDAADTLASTA